MKSLFLHISAVAALALFVAGSFFVWQRISSPSSAVVASEVVVVDVLPDRGDVVVEVEQEEGVVVEEIEVEEVVVEEEIVPAIPEPSIPTELNLPVPFTSQAPERNWDQPWQDACEEAAVLMLDAYYKNYNLSPLFAKDEILKMVGWQDAQGWGYSIDATQMVGLVSEYMSEQARIITDPTVDQIKQSVAAGHPVLVLAYGKALPNPFFSGDGPEYHALIIRGYTETEFITNDPGTWRGENFHYAYDDLMHAIHDWNGGDVPNGARTVLVLQ